MARVPIGQFGLILTFAFLENQTEKGPNLTGPVWIPESGSNGKDGEGEGGEDTEAETIGTIIPKRSTES